ncbi:MAG: DegT/DnrJ/EryC1/StrS family aminotransferase [bacterium]
MIPFVDLKKQYQSIKNEIDEAIQKVCQNTDFILGKDVELFEQEFALYCETKFAIGVDSGTSALELALKALDIGHGDEVITSANTFFATVSAIVATGAKPILIDINPKTYNMDPILLDKSITKKTKAIIPVHLYGQPADMDEINLIARKYKLKVVEDACQSHGAKYKGKRCGSLSDIGCFSFYPGKNLGAYGDGGALTTNNSNIAQKIKMLRNYGQKKKYHHSIIGFNRRLDTIQAAILRIKLKHLDEWNKLRNQNAKYYNNLLKNLLIVPEQEKNRDHVFHLYVIRTKKRDMLQEYLTQNEIYTTIHYPIPIHFQKAFSYLNYQKGSFPITEKYAKEILSLPMFPELTQKEIEIVVEKIRNFYGKI